jgi:hypothetical protein
MVGDIYEHKYARPADEDDDSAALLPPSKKRKIVSNLCIYSINYEITSILPVT